MKLASLLGAAIVLCATTALAHDLTYTGPIKSGETKSVKVNLPDGKMTVEVFSPNVETKFNCQFSYTYGGVVDEQKNTPKCLRNFIVQSENTMVVSLTNLGKDSDYRIWVHDTK